MRESLCAKTAVACLLWVLGLTAAVGAEETFTLVLRMPPEAPLTYRLEETRTDRVGSTSRTTIAETLLNLSPAAGRPGVAVTLKKHRIGQTATPLEGLSAVVDLDELASGGIGSLIMPYFPALPEKPVAVGESWQAPFVIPSAGRIRYSGEVPKARYQLARVVREGSALVAELTGTAEVHLEDAVLLGSELGIERRHIPAVKVEPGSAAYRAGLRSGDRIWRLGGKTVTTWEEAAAMRFEGAVTIETLARPVGGESAVEPGHSATYNVETSAGGNLGSIGIDRLGVEVPDSTEVIVGKVEEGSPAAAAGISPGDRIIRLGGAPVSTWGELESVLGMIPPSTAIPLQRVRAGSGDAVTAGLTTGSRELGHFSLGGTFSGAFRLDISLGELLGAAWKSDEVVMEIGGGSRPAEVKTRVSARISLMRL